MPATYKYEFLPKQRAAALKKAAEEVLEIRRMATAVRKQADALEQRVLAAEKFIKRAAGLPMTAEDHQEVESLLKESSE